MVSHSVFIEPKEFSVVRHTLTVTFTLTVDCAHVCPFRARPGGPAIEQIPKLPAVMWPLITLFIGGCESLRISVGWVRLSCKRKLPALRGS